MARMARAEILHGRRHFYQHKLITRLFANLSLLNINAVCHHFNPPSNTEGISGVRCDLMSRRLAPGGVEASSLRCFLLEAGISRSIILNALIHRRR